MTLRVAYLTPLPPTKSGIAAYSLMLLPELAKLCALTLVVAQDTVTESAPLPVLQWSEFLEREQEFDHIICQIGNNPHHEQFYRYAMAHPCVVVLHDLVLHHLIVEMTLARGDVAGYVTALEENHGAAGAAWARGRAAGLHDEIGNFLFPASLELARRSRHVLVHNRYAASVLSRGAVSTPMTVVDHPLPVMRIDSTARNAIRSQHRIGADDIVVAMFGFVTAAKRPEVVFEAFARALMVDRRLRLLVVGEAAPNVDLDALITRFGIDRTHVHFTGYVSDEDFVRYLSAVDKVVNLRYPSAGETSGALMHVIAAGVDVAVSDYGPFTDLPQSVAARIPLGVGEVETLTTFLASSASNERREGQRAFISGHASVGVIAAAYVEALDGRDGAKCEQPRSQRLIPLFPLWEVSHETVEGTLRLTMHYRGEGSIRAPLYGEPAYRLVVKGYDKEQRQTFDRWLSPEGDCAPGAALQFLVRLPESTSTVALYDAAEGFPPFGDAFAKVEVSC